MTVAQVEIAVVQHLINQYPLGAAIELKCSCGWTSYDVRHDAVRLATAHLRAVGADRHIMARLVQA